MVQAEAEPKEAAAPFATPSIAVVQPQAVAAALAQV
jgi:hypothetical protein